VERDERELM